MCPPGVDQTERSGQNWSLLAPILEQRQPGFGGYSFFLNRDKEKKEPTFRVFDRLVPNVDVSESDLARFELSSSASSSVLESLPSEMIRMVISECGLAFCDIISLAACSKSLWNHAMSYVMASSAQGTWVNTPLVCVGTYLTSLPPALYEYYPDMEQQELDFKENRFDGYNRGTCPARRWNYSITRGQEEDWDTRAAWIRAYERLSEQEQGNLPLETKKMIIRAVFGKGSQSGTCWLLRNLTTKEYLRCELANTEKGNIYAHVDQTPSLSLDCAVFMQTYWTRKGGINEETPRGGDWAAHKFDVVARTREGAVLASGYTDVTNNIILASKDSSARKLFDFGHNDFSSVRNE